MTTQKILLNIPRGPKNPLALMRLDQYLAEALPEPLGQPISKGQVRKLIMAGVVYINRRRVKIASRTPEPGDRIEVHVNRERLNNPRISKELLNLKEEDVIFEDRHLIVVNKPGGIPTQPTLDQDRDHLFAAVQRFLKARTGHDTYVGLHHRLDHDTSGLVLFTKAKSANKGISDLFKDRQIQKTYMAVVAPLVAPPQTWTIKNHLAKRAGKGKRMRMCSVTSGGDFAETHFRILKKGEKATLVEALPKTGRTHQIRIHLAENKMPILGDATYGTKKSAPRLMLHAYRLSFQHPITGEKLRLESPIPSEFQEVL